MLSEVICSIRQTVIVLLRWQEFATRSVAVFLDMPWCHRGDGASGEYRSVSRLGLLIRNMWNRWMSRLPDRDRSGCPRMRYCSLHGTVWGALSETVAPVSLNTVPRLSLLSQQCCHLGVGKRTPCGGGRAVSPTPTRPAVRSRGIKWGD